MLFSRVYNWIKYKTLPPSVLFLNRLYVERDSKHRRTTSNLGLTFRNSKWSSYARTNINLNNKTNYLWLLLRAIGFLFLLIGVFNFSSFYNTSTLTSSLYSVIWFAFDADLYVKAAVCSSLLCVLQISAAETYYSVVQHLTHANNSIDSRIAILDALLIPKRLQRPLLFAWTQSAPWLSVGYSRLFSNSTRTDSSEVSLSFYRSLYLSVYLLRQSEPNLYKLQSLVRTLENQPRSMAESYVGAFAPTTPDKFNLIALEALLLKESRLPESRSQELTSIGSLDSVHAELANSNISLKALNGLFYLPSLSHTTLNSCSTSFPELAGFSSAIQQQLSAIRWDRWLYKYNILHRSTLTAANQISSAKSLVSSGFYSSSLAVRNIWAASTFNRSSSFRDLYDALYGDVSSASRLTPSSLPSASPLKAPSLESLGAYESSYFWFVQRFYNFSTLGTNTKILKPQVVDNVAIRMGTTFSDFQNTQTILTSQAQSSLRFPESSLGTNFESTSSRLGLSNTSGSDVYLNYYDYSLISKSRAELMHNLISNRTGRSIYFYSNLN